MKKTHLILLVLLLMIPVNSCALGLIYPPTAIPTPGDPLPSSTPMLVTLTLPAPSATATNNLPSPTAIAAVTATPTTGVTPVVPTATASLTPSALMGPYAVVLVTPGDTLNIRNAAGAGGTLIGSFPANAINVMRTGPSSTVGSDLWVQVQVPGSAGTGWVNAKFLTEYVTPSAFCADGRVNTLLTNLAGSLTASSGDQLSPLVSPAHGMTVWLWRYGDPVTFDAGDARWIFESTFVHHWGQAPGSGLETNGSFHTEVLPKLQEVFNASPTLTCNTLGSAPQYGTAPWPQEYASINYYTVYKPGTPGVDLDWRYWLVGVEYVGGQPTVFALAHFQWEP